MTTVGLSLYTPVIYVTVADPGRLVGRDWGDQRCTELSSITKIPLKNLSDPFWLSHKIVHCNCAIETVFMGCNKIFRVQTLNLKLFIIAKLF